MADPTNSGGLLGGIDPSLLLSLGAGLLSQRGAGSSLGAGLLGGMGAYQQQRQAGQQYQMGQQEQQLRAVQLRQALQAQGLRDQFLGSGQQGAQAPPAPSPAPLTPPPGIAAPGPSAGSTAAQQILGGGWMPQQGQPQQTPKLQKPDITPLLAPTDPRLGMVDPDIYKMSEAGRTAKIQQIYSTQVVPHAQNFSDVAAGSRSMSSLPADEQQLFRDTAGQMGTDLSTVNGQRTVAAALHNSWTAQFGNPPVRPDLEREIDKSTGLYVDPLSGKPLEQFAKVLDKSGHVLSVPEHAQGGYAPYTTPLFNLAQLTGGVPGGPGGTSAPPAAPPAPPAGGATGSVALPSAPPAVSPTSPAETRAQQVAHYQSQMSPREAATPAGAIIMQRVQQLNPDYDATKYQEKQRGQIYYSTGKGAQTLSALNNAADHLDTLSNAAQALNNGNVQLANSILNGLSKQFGGTAPATYEALMPIVAGEVNKVVNPGGGTGGERGEGRGALASNLSPAQFLSNKGGVQSLMLSQLKQQQRQYVDATGLPPETFAKKLSPAVAGMLTAHADNAAAGPQSSLRPAGAPPPLPPRPGKLPARPKGGLSDADLLKKWGS